MNPNLHNRLYDLQRQLTNIHTTIDYLTTILPDNAYARSNTHGLIESSTYKAIVQQIYDLHTKSAKTTQEVLDDWTSQ